MVADPPLDEFDLTETQVRERFAAARRSGHPTWLWPDVQPTAWRAELARIEAVTRAVLAGETASEPLYGEPAALGIAAYTSGMGPLLGHWLETGRLSASEPVSAVLRVHLRHNRLRMERLTAEAVAGVDRLAAAGANPVVLKGMHTAHEYFPEPGTRPSSDVDLLIDRADVPAGERALRDGGYAMRHALYAPYRCNWAPPAAPALPRTLAFVHADDPWALDVQESLSRTFSPSAVARLDELRGDGRFPRWRLADCAGVLPQPVLTLFLAAHASENTRSLTLLRLVELVFVVQRDVASGALSWPELEDAADRAGSLGLVYPALRMLEQLAPGTVPAPVLKAAAARVPATVVRVLGGLTPASAASVDRMSMRERYMWSPTWPARLRQLAYELGPGPAGHSARNMVGIYTTRAWRLLRGTVGR